MADGSATAEDRVLVLAPIGRDAALACGLLGEAGIPAAACQDLDDLHEHMAEGAGALVIAQEALDNDAALFDDLKQQPAWSDVPVILLTTAQGDEFVGKLAQDLFGPANVTLLERPFRGMTLVSVLRGALRSRRRQYEVRDLLAQREKLLESERAARTDAEVANRMKDEFLAGLSHELRTPLNAILGWCQVLQMGDLSPEESKEALAIIERNSRAQAELIEDLLDVSRIISGKLRLDMGAVYLPDVVDAALTSVMPSAEAKQITIERAIDPTVGSVSGDSTRLQQVVWNLLSNAIKFTPKGGRVQVRLRRVQSQTEIEVTDTGAGIGAQFLPYVFDRFRQADASTTRRHGGLGLGLSIVRQLVELHGGSVRAASAGEGQGATFVVRLPIAAVQLPIGSSTRRPQRPAEPSTPVCEEPILEGLRVLVVDDDDDGRGLVERVLVECGATVDGAASADDALRKVPEFHPDLLISDVGMPGRDGYDLIREIRRGGRDARSLPAVALTAFARSEDRQRALMAGFQMHVTKPVNANELTAVVASLTGRTGHRDLNGQPDDSP